VEARVRAWATDEEMYAGTALSGMTEEDTALLFKITGRPLSFRQVFIGLRRGGVYNGPTDHIHPAFLKALEESNVRPEWYNLAWAIRESYPSAFVIRFMAQGGDLNAAETEQILLYVGWPESLAKTVAGRWAATGTTGGKKDTVTLLETEYEGGQMTETEYRKALATLGYTGTVQDHLVALGNARRAKAYREKVIDAIHKAYVGFAINDGQAQEELATVNLTGEPFTELLGLWAKERLYTIRQLTAAQVKTAYLHNIIPQASALQALEWLHYTPASAQELLSE
jgi:hypothetical protein